MSLGSARSRTFVGLAAAIGLALPCLLAFQAAKPHDSAVSTGEAHAAVLDAEHRPITAGGFVDHGPVIFQNIAGKAGLATWRHVMGTPEKQIRRGADRFR